MLAELSGVRFRVLDEHSYRVEDAGRVATFRLQLFISAAGLRPVAVAVQDVTEGGVSLTNGCEAIVSQVWQDHFPDQSLPPLWVQRIITPTYPQWDTNALSSWQMVTFDIQPPHGLSAPEWTGVAQAELDRLVGRTVDDQRGRAATAPEPSRDDIDYALVPMHQMPQGNPFRAACMNAAAMAAAPPRRRPRWRGRGDDTPDVPVTSVPVTGTCCWYHGGDWVAVTDTAARLICQVKARGLGADDELRFVVLEAGRAEGLTGWAQQALNSLLMDPIVVVHAGDGHEVGFVNGQHRVRAMREAGVTEVLVAARPLIGKVVGPPLIDER
ncbi:MAG: hypothetical protein QOF58_3249 [Pseudonocardiales bacterium]|jgi:hypothetical protein|nr:hypothetical protein [Pseudonocardiales bacterium]